MATLNAQLVPLQITPGVQPIEDRTPLSTPHYVFSDKVRFWRGVPQKIGGWLAVPFQYTNSLRGIARTLFSAVIQNQITTLIGTSYGLYGLYGQRLTNITPLQASTVAIPNSLNTVYDTLPNNPITTQIGSNTVTIQATSDIQAQMAGDLVTISGATAVGGIGIGALNTQFVIRSINTSNNTFTVYTGTAATSTATGGGAAVIYATGLVVVGQTAHGLNDGDRIGVTLAVAVGGITAPQLNKEFIVRVPSANKFYLLTTGTATSSVSNGGGAATVYQKQLASGAIDQSFGAGYGLGLYGAGFYGVSKMSVSGVTFPRIWFPDRFGENILVTAGNQSGIYNWDGGLTTAPTLLTNAPTDVNYMFVSDNIVVTVGHQNIGNQIFSSDQGDPTQWTASSLNQVYQDVIEGADRFLSHVPVLGINLLFTQSQTYRFSYIGLPNIWETKLLDNSVGIIAPMARVSVNNIAYWMSHNNFYRWSGGNIEQIPANSQDQCTCLQYVFGNINNGQVSKAFAWYNDQFNEIWFHYPSSTSTECDRIVRVSISDNVWSIDTMDRTCSESPANLFLNPRMISSGGTLYNHEVGNDDNTSPLAFQLTSNYRSSGKETALVTGFVPDSIQTGSINVNLKAYQWPQTGVTTYDKTFVVADNGARENIQIGGRFWQYDWSGAVLGQNWVMGQWNELVQKGNPN